MEGIWVILVALLLVVTEGSTTFYEKSVVAQTSRSCVISNKENCTIADMPKDLSTQVYPGSDTRCIYSYSTKYSFQVIPGDSDKLLYYFEGGGACWSEKSTNPVFCSVDAEPVELSGVFNRTDPRNRYRHFTIVIVLYCSGDVHAGNITRDYDDNLGRPIKQLGYHNARAVLDWTVEQQSSGALATFSELQVMGCSAGALGAQLWISTLLNELFFEKVAVIPDSYLGVFPDGVEGPLIYDYGYCTTPLVDPTLYEKCMAQSLTFEDIVMVNLPKHHDVPFAFIQSKVDSIQYLFYGLLQGPADNNMSLSEFYYYSNILIENYNLNNNFAIYLVDGASHCFTNKDRYYSADTCGSNSNENNTAMDCDKDESVMWMWDWTGLLPFTSYESTTLSTSCTGNLTVPDPYSDSTTYCNDNIIPKDLSSADYLPASEDDDGYDVGNAVAISASLVIVVAFLAIGLYCWSIRRSSLKDDTVSLRDTTLSNFSKQKRSTNGNNEERESNHVSSEL